MTRVDFHVNVADKIGYACRLVRKAYRAGGKVVVCGGEPGVLDHFDTALWTFSPLDFVPHVRAADPLADQTPVLLAPPDQRPEALPHHEMLVNLGGAQPGWFSSFDRLFEIVGLDAADREAGRARWRFYRERGYPLNMHDLAAADARPDA